MLWLYYAYVVAAATWGLHWSNSMIMLYKGMLWLYYAYVVAATMDALPARREETCLWFLWLLESPSSFLAHALPALCLTDSVNSETTGIMNRMQNNTATHSSILAWAILWTEEPRGLQSMGLSRVRYHWLEALDQNTFNFLGAWGYSTSQKEPQISKKQIKYLRYIINSGSTPLSPCRKQAILSLSTQRQKKE